MQKKSLKQKEGGNLGASAALNPKRIKIGWTACERSRGGKKEEVHHTAVTLRHPSYDSLTHPRTGAPPPYNLDEGGVAPARGDTLNPKP